MRSRTAAAAKRQLPRLAINATPYASHHTLLSPSSSISSSSAQASGTTSVDTPFSAEIFHVLCLYDFEASDPDQLSFRKNEVLDIVQQEASGWWAALRQGDGAASVGWIPSAYVEPISEQTAERLRARGHRIHIQVNTERLNPPIVDEYSPLGMSSPGDAIREYEWMPLSDAAKNLSHMMSPIRFPNDVLSPAIESPLVFPDDDLCTSSQVLTVPDSSRIRAACPPSPSTPMPKPPLQVSMTSGPQSAPIQPSPARFPQSPCSTKSPATVIFSRQFRRRPVLIEETTSLSHLSTLLESSNVTEVDFLVSSPVVAESLDTYARIARASSDKVKQITGDDDAQAIYSAQVAQSALPWFLKPDHREGDIRVEYDGSISSGTLPALVERLTVEHFMPLQEKQYRHAFLMTYPTFCSANEVFTFLLLRYHMSPPSGLTVEETALWKQKKLSTSQRRVFTTFATWLEHFRLVEDEPSIAQRLQEFLSSIRSPRANEVTAKQLMKTLERLTFAASPEPVPFPPSTHKHRRKKGSKDELYKTDATRLAEHICLYEHNLYKKIRTQDCLDYVKRQDGIAERLIAFCKTHERLANWVKSSVLNLDTAIKRAQMVDFWIKVAEKCRAFNAYSSLSAIVAALTSTVLTRLHSTWAHVDRSNHLEPLATFSEPMSGMSNYRTAQQAIDGPCVPFIGMYLTDLLHVNEHFSNYAIVDDNPNSNMINFTKRERLYEVVDSLLRHQKQSYRFEDSHDPNLLVFVEVSLLHAAEVDQGSLWKMSQDVHRNEMMQADVRRGLEAAGF